MKKQQPKYAQKSSDPDRYWVRKQAFDSFGSDILGLADLTKEKKTFEALAVICSDYVDVFLDKNFRSFTQPPLMLRCGIAQGQVTAIANGNDYVGMCINVASRLQKLADDAFSFGFTQKGLEPEEGSGWYDHFTLIQIKIRGLAKPEFVYVFRSEFNKLPIEEQLRLTPPKQVLTSRRKVR